MREQRRAVIFALIAVAMWSTVATAFELALKELAPLQLLLLATIVSTVVFWIAAISRGWPSTSRRDFACAFLFGLLNPFAYYLILFEAYDRLPPQIAQPINYTWAIALALLAVPVLGQRLALRTLAGILTAYAGVVILLTEGRLDRLPAFDGFGVLLAFASTLVWAGYWLLNARARIEPFALMALSFTFATPLVVAACTFGPGLPRLTGRAIALGIWVGAVEMGITFLLWQQALRLTTNAGKLGQLIFLSPFLSLVLIANVLGEVVHWTSVAGLIVIVVGLWITQSTKS